MQENIHILLHVVYQGRVNHNYSCRMNSIFINKENTNFKEFIRLTEKRWKNLK